MTSLPRRSRRRRPDMRRVVILFPSGLTLGNLFFGVFAIIAASRLEFVAAGVYVLLGGICDALDGRVARATNAGTEFGEELDSLVDAITFGLAPGMIMYFAVLNRSGWDWVWVFLFTACAVLRLARFNIEQAGTSKTYFQGLPSPAAGITLASYYWFSQSSLYTYGAIADLKWHVLLRYLMVVLSFLMISNVPYPVFPRTGFRSLRAIGATVLLIGSAVLLATRKLEYFFPFALVYVAWGLARWVFAGIFERRQPTVPYDLSEGEDDEDDDDEDEEFEWTDSRVHASRQGHREEREEREQRVERARREERPVRPERSERASGSRARPERGAAKPAPVERPEERSPRAPDSERAAGRERKKERPPRTERPSRAVRPERAGQTSATESAPNEPPIETAIGVDAITLGEPDAALELSSSAAEGVIENEPLAVPDGGAAEGASGPRKRKRRRRRGERKDRPSPAELAGESSNNDERDPASDDTAALSSHREQSSEADDGPGRISRANHEMDRTEASPVLPPAVSPAPPSERPPASEPSE